MLIAIHTFMKSIGRKLKFVSLFQLWTGWALCFDIRLIEKYFSMFVLPSGKRAHQKDITFMTQYCIVCIYK